MAAGTTPARRPPMISRRSAARSISSEMRGHGPLATTRSCSASRQATDAVEKMMLSRLSAGEAATLCDLLKRCAAGLDD